MVLYVHKNLEEWALCALRNAGYDVDRVVRVYQPQDADGGDCADVLWIEEPGRACTTYMEPTGRVVVTLAGFG